MLSEDPLQFLRTLVTYLPYIPLLLIAKYLLTNLITSTRNRLTSDLESIPGPPVAPWNKYTVGHNILYDVICKSSFETAELFNSWRSAYGPIFQIRSLFGQRAVFISSETAIREVTIAKHALFIKPRATHNALAPLVGKNGILLAEGANHTRLRRTVAPAMHHEALITVGGVFLEQGRLLAQRLAEMGDKGDDVLREVRISTFAVIFETCFGTDAAPPEVVTRLQDSYLEAFLEPPLRSFASLILQSIFWFVDVKRFSYREDLKQYIRETIYRLCAERTRQGEGGSSAANTPLLTLMVDEDTKKTITNQEMVETVLSFLAAGQVTTSMSVCWTLYLLAREVKWLTRLVNELKGWSEQDGLDVLDRLPLLDRIVKESIRLYPPVFFVNRLSTESVELDGYKIAKGTTVRMAILAIHRNEDIWGPDAHEFNPDRFLRQGELARTKMFWCVFLFGPRSCIGQRFALLELKAFVAQVLASQRLYVKPLEDPAPTCMGSFATPRGMKLYFQNRE